MSFCPKCGNPVEANAASCPNCGTVFAPAPAAPVYTAPVAPVAVDPYDHTAEFTAEDVAENRIYAKLMYLMGIFGVIIALLAAKDSPYVKFHVKQVLSATVCEILLGIAAAVLAITIIVPIAAVIAIVVLTVVEIICFFKVCANKSVEIPIVRSFGLFK